MKKRKCLLAAALMVLSPAMLLGQHRGSHGATAPPPAGQTSSDDMKDFSRAIALQASPEQVNTYRQLTSSLDSARKRVADFQHPAEGVSTSEFARAKAVSDAADDAQGDSERFLSSFTDAQKSGLKALAKKARKADSEIMKQSKVLNGSPSHPAAEKLGKSLQELQESQLAIAKEMGIPGVEETH